MAEVTGWNDIPDNSTLIFMLFKTSSAITTKVKVSVYSRASGSFQSREVTSELTLNEKWGGKSSLPSHLGRDHSHNKLFVDSSWSVSGTVVERPVDVRFVYIE